ncbi:hypothetical protein GCM10023310_47380 [Paenibacillus vulneris]
MRNTVPSAAGWQEPLQGFVAPVALRHKLSPALPFRDRNLSIRATKYDIPSI